LKEAKNREKLGQDLSNEKPEGGGSQLGDIVLAMKKLEEEVIAYRQGKRDKKDEGQTKENTQPYFLVDMAGHNQEVDEDENNSQTENVSDNNSSAPVLNSQVISKDKKRFSLTSNLKKWRKSPTHSDESYELQNQEQIAQTLHVPPYGVPGSSKK